MTLILLILGALSAGLLVFDIGPATKFFCVFYAVLCIGAAIVVAIEENK